FESSPGHHLFSKRSASSRPFLFSARDSMGSPSARAAGSHAHAARFIQRGVMRGNFTLHRREISSEKYYRSRPQILLTDLSDTLE
ncbi:hypothetical protein, partial [Burkholderia vietnamiensis]|uniref:hypothetical protein n=1 Tax=Burkholderia vietnamiensis TaxID=60552 RepID=UPI001E45A975